MPPVKVLHLTSTPRGIGGVERLLLDMAPHYDPARVSVRHCNLFDAAGGSGAFPAALKATSLPYDQVDGTRWFQLPGVISQVRRIFRHERIDVLHLHMVHATIVGGIVSMLPGAPRVIVTKHYVYRALTSPLLRTLDRAFTNRADAVIAVSDHVRGDLARNGANASKLQVIHNGIDLESFDRLAEPPSTQVRDSEDELLIGCVGNLHPIKGHTHLIRAMPAIIREFPKARLVMIGEGPEHERLTTLAASLGVERSVRFLGFRADVPAILRQVDIYVQPSLQESFGMVLLEAMAAGRPVVATDVEGIPEIVVEGVTGRLVPPANPEALATAICALLGNSDRRNEMGRAARTRVEQLFGIRKTVRAYERLYEELAFNPGIDAIRTPG